MLSVTDEPSQAGGGGVMEGWPMVLMVTATLLLAVQPFVSVTVTVKVVAEAGLTEMI